MYRQFIINGHEWSLSSACSSEQDADSYPKIPTYKKLSMPESGFS
jgi:hypothetical protein